jgi:uncharacterized protein (TIGR02284 family)
MDNQKVVELLADLAQLDIDASHAYEQALKNIDQEEVYRHIDMFRNDHLRHIDELNSLIEKYDGEPVENTQDFKGYLIEGFTSLRSMTGTEGALKAMESNEVLTNKNYKNALDKATTVPEDVKKLLQANYGDEQRHLDYIRNTLKRLSQTEKATEHNMDKM